MRRQWRLIDSGIRRAAEHLALNRALLESRKQGGAAAISTLRFLQFRPSALLGFHQSAEQELNLDYCAGRGIDIQRRITGGGAIYMDETQLGWELYLHKSELGTADMTAIARRICDVAAGAIASFGVDARFRPRNDIEVAGKKISGTGGAFDGDALLYQGTLLVEFDVAEMLRILRIPGEKISGKAIADARERVVNLADLLGHVPPLAEVKARLQQAFAEEFGVDLQPGMVSDAENNLFARALAEIDTPQWIHLVNKPVSDLPIVEASRKFAGGLLRAAVAYEPVAERIRQVWFTGDIFVSPRRTLADLEAALKNAAVADLEAIVGKFFSVRQVDMLGLTAGDFVSVLRRALTQARPAVGPAVAGVAR